MHTLVRILAVSIVAVTLAGCAANPRSHGSSDNRTPTVAQPDADNDGVADASDRCPQSEEDDGRWGSDAHDGCPGTLDDLLRLAASDLNAFWEKQFQGQRVVYEPPLRFEGYIEPIETGCGQSVPDNAFYCSADHAIYFDENFLNNELAQNGDFDPVLIIAHEWGHLVQATVGELQSGSVLPIELELQADCLAGAWSSDANRRGLLERRAILRRPWQHSSRLGTPPIGLLRPMPMALPTSESMPSRLASTVAYRPVRSNDLAATARPATRWQDVNQQVPSSSRAIETPGTRALRTYPRRTHP